MTIDRRSLLIAILPALLISAQAARAQAAWSWDGTWTGMLGKAHPWPMSVVIAEGKVISYTLKGTPLESGTARSVRLLSHSATAITTACS